MQIDVERVLPARNLKRPLMAFAAVLAVTLLIFSVAPAVWQRGVVRLVDPTGNHPPYTSLHFAISSSPDMLYVGDMATVTVAIDGPAEEIPEQADLVFADSDARGRAVSRLPMIRTDEGRFELVLDSLRGDAHYYIDTPNGRSDARTLTVQKTPLFVAGEVYYQYPPYTDWAPTSHAIPGRPIRALVGSQVTLQVHSNVALAKSDIVLTFIDTDGQVALSGRYNGNMSQTVPLVPDDLAPVNGQATFTLRRSGKCRIRLLGRDGAPGREPLVVPVVAIADRPPRVEIESPEERLAVVQGWKVPVKVLAHDDVQLESLQLNVLVNDQPIGGVPLEDQDVRREAAEGTYEFDLPLLGLKPGDRVRYFVTATDNYRPEPHASDSRVQTMEVISLEQYAQFLREQYRMEHLRDEIAAIQERLEQQRAAREAMLEFRHEVYEPFAVVVRDRSSECHGGRG